MPQATDIEPWLLDHELRRILSERQYQFALVGLDELGLSKPKDEFRTEYNSDQFEDAEHGAALWLQWVLDGPRHIHGSRKTHEAHNILEDLVSRGWQWAVSVELIRAAQDPSTCENTPPDARPTVQALRQVLASAHAGSEREDKLWLMIGQTGQQVAETLSIWAAIAAAPPRVHRLDGAELDKHVHRLVRAINGANKHWDALRRLGLSPISWMSKEAWEDDGKLSKLGTNQAMSALTLLKAAEDLAAAEGRDAPSVEDFRGAWAAAPVLKRMTFDDFANSAAGQAIMAAARNAQAMPEEDASYDPDDVEPSDLASDDDLSATFEHLAASGEFDELDLRMLQSVISGKSLADLHARDKAFRLKFRSLADLGAHLEGLQDRVVFVVRQAQLRNE